MRFFFPYFYELFLIPPLLACQERGSSEKGLILTTDGENITEWLDERTVGALTVTGLLPTPIGAEELADAPRK